MPCSLESISVLKYSALSRFGISPTRNDCEITVELLKIFRGKFALRWTRRNVSPINLPDSEPRAFVGELRRWAVHRSSQEDVVSRFFTIYHAFFVPIPASVRNVFDLQRSGYVTVSRKHGSSEGGTSDLQLTRATGVEKAIECLFQKHCFPLIPLIISYSTAFKPQLPDPI